MSKTPTRDQLAETVKAVHDHGINCETREIWLMSAPANEEDGIDYVCANTFIKNLRILQSHSTLPILIHQCTCGGEWSYGIAIHDAIKASKAPIALLAHAHARSMSSIIPQAAKLRIIAPNADFLIHFGTLGLDGDARSVVAEAEWCKQLNERMFDIYAARCARGPYFRRKKWGREKVKECYLRPVMNEKREVYMDAAESVDKGFMDVVLGAPGFETLEAVQQTVSQLGKRRTH